MSSWKGLPEEPCKTFLFFSFFFLLDNDFYLLRGFGWFVYPALVALVTVVLRQAISVDQAELKLTI